MDELGDKIQNEGILEMENVRRVPDRFGPIFPWSL